MSLEQEINDINIFIEKLGSGFGIGHIKTANGDYFLEKERIEHIQKELLYIIYKLKLYEKYFKE